MSTVVFGPVTDILYSELYVCRGRLEQAFMQSDDVVAFEVLLCEVDVALGRIARGTYGFCDMCHELIEASCLLADPFVWVCLDHLTIVEQCAFEDDLEFVSRIQVGLLSIRDLVHPGWWTAYVYQPYGIVSGDYCDLVPVWDGSLYFMLGDVSGKGVVVSMLMSQFQAMFWTLIEVELPLVQIMECASWLFCESTLPMQYAMLVCGRVTPDGYVEIANAGHLLVVLLGSAGAACVGATGLLIGMWLGQEFGVRHLDVAIGDTLVLCTDGVIETEDPDG